MKVIATGQFTVYLVSDEVTARLSSDIHGVPTDANGENSNYAGASTTLTILEGSTDVTSEWNITVEESNGGSAVEGLLSGATYTVTSLLSDSAIVTFTATRDEYPDMIKEFKIVRQRQGIAGVDARNYYMNTDVSNIKQLKDGTFIPSNIEFDGKLRIGSKLPEDYSGYFVVYEQSRNAVTVDDYTNLVKLGLIAQDSEYIVSDLAYPYVERYSSATAESHLLYEYKANPNMLLIEFYDDIDRTNILDIKTIPIVIDGSSAYNMYISPSDGIVFKFDKDNVNTGISSTTLTATSTNIENATYAWEKDGVVVSGNTSNVLTVENTALASVNSASYKCTVSGIANGENVTLTDTATVIKTKDGATGLSSYSIGLVNESVNITTDENGTGYDLANARTGVILYLGTTSRTGTIGTITASGCTATTDGTTMWLTGINAGANDGYVDVQIKDGSTVIGVKRFTFSKTKQGITAVSYWILPSVNTIVKGMDSSLNPSTITFNGYSKNGTNNPIAYSGRMVITESIDGETFGSPTYISSVNESTKTYTPSSSSVKSVKVKFYQSGATTYLIDEETIPVIETLDNMFFGGENLVLNSTAQTVPELDNDYFGDTKLIVSDQLDALYATYPNPPIGGVFNNINHSTMGLVNGNRLDTPPALWAVINLVKLYNQTGNSKYLDRAILVGNYLTGSMTTISFLGLLQTVMPNRRQYTAGNWDNQLSEVSIRNQYQTIWALLELYKVTSNIYYKTKATEIMRTIGYASNQLNGRVGSELASYMLGAQYENFIDAENGRHVFSLGTFGHSCADVMAKAIPLYIEVVGNTSVVDGNGVVFTPQRLMDDYITHFKAIKSNSKIDNGLGLPYSYLTYTEAELSGGIYSPIGRNYDWVTTMAYGTDVWFANDQCLWTILGLAEMGKYKNDSALTTIANTYRNNFLNLRILTHSTYANAGDEVLFYDRYNINGTHIVDDESISISATGSFWSVDEALGVSDYSLHQEIRETLLTHQVKDTGNANVDGAFYWDASDTMSYTETKATGEIWDSPFYDVLLELSESSTSKSYLIREYTISQDFVEGMEYTVSIKGSINAGQSFGLFQNGGETASLGNLVYKPMSGTYALTFKSQAITVEGTERKFMLCNVGADIISATVEWIKLEKGNVATDYSKAKEDTESAINIVASRTSAVESAITVDSITNTVMGSTKFSAKLAEYAKGDDLSNYATTGELSGVKSTAELAKKAIEELDLTPYVLATQIEQLENSITSKVSQSGGVNMLRNSIGWSGIDFWAILSGAPITIQTPELETFGFGSGWHKKHGTTGTGITQTVNLPIAGTYTISFKMNKNTETAVAGKYSACGIYVDSLPFYGKGTGSGITSGFEDFSLTFTTTKLTADISVVIGELAEATISGVMLNLGSSPLQWTSHGSEVYNTNVRMDINGVQVMGNRSGKRTVINTEEFAGYENNEKVFTVNGDTTEVKKLKAEQQFAMTPITIITINNASYQGWAFI